MKLSSADCARSSSQAPRLISYRDGSDSISRLTETSRSQFAPTGSQLSVLYCRPSQTMVTSKLTSSKAIDVMQLKFGRLHVQLVVAAGNHRGNREPAVGGQFGNLALPCSGQHIADLADPILHRVVDLCRIPCRSSCAAIFIAVFAPTVEDAGAAQQAAKSHHSGHRLRSILGMSRRADRLQRCNSRPASG